MLVVFHGGRVDRNYTGNVENNDGLCIRGDKARKQASYPDVRETSMADSLAYGCKIRVTPVHNCTIDYSVPVAQSNSHTIRDSDRGIGRVNGAFVQQCSYLRCVDVPGMLPGATSCEAPLSIR